MKVGSSWAFLLCLSLLPVLMLGSLTGMYKIFNPDSEMVGSFPLGFIPGNTTLDIQMRTINGANVGGQFEFLLYNPRRQVVSALTTTCAAGSNLCKKQVLITDGMVYEIALIPTGATAEVIPYYLNVISYPGTTINPSLGTQLLKVVDARIGGGFVKFFSVRKGTYNFTAALFPTDPGTSVFDVAEYDLNTLAFIQSDTILAGYPQFSNRVQTASYDLRAGLHALSVFKGSTPPNELLITWPSQPYPCPYDTAYSDFYNIFKGCVATASSREGLPCSSFDRIAQQCRQCISGYLLDPTTSNCIANTTCLSRQYYHFGSCLPVDVRCGNFDPFTGNCLTCANASLVLANGVCSLITVVCSPRQWQSGIECRDVSENCDTFDPSNGQCLSCKNYTFELQKGACVPLVLVCPPGQYEVNFGCLSIPAECVNFDTANRVCLACIQGYFVQGGECQRIVCPPNQVPSRFGLFCIDVSPLCSTFDPLNGDCLSCVNPNYKVNAKGQCSQYVSPLAGCRERERLGYGKCVEPEKDCKAYNLVTGNCDECERGFFIDYTGHCQREAQCGAGRWSVNGECLGTPENCLRTNSLGLCDLCVNADYRLEGGACVRVRRCAAGQFLNGGGQCVDVSAECGLFNPSNGECVTCKSGANPQLGHCCAVGSVFDGSECVAEGVLQSVRSSFTGSECLAFHPSLGYCLNCNQGYTVDPITQTTCRKE